jgi:DNA polymerase elongation subunit (family B)
MEVEDLPKLIEDNDVAGIKQLMEKHNLSVVDGKLIANDKDKFDELSDYYDTIQLVKKILLNSQYGSISNPASNFFDIRMGSSTTLGGRCTTRHMGSKINELLGGEYELGEMITYGDTDSIIFDSIIETENGNITVEQLYHNGTMFWKNGDKEY